MSQSKRWTFTLNNYTPLEYESITSVECKYLIVGKEVGEQGTPHLQGYVVFPSNQRMRAVKSKLGSRCHLEIARGDSEENKVYCSKENNFFEKGDCPVSNGGTREKRNWEQVYESAKSNDFSSIPADCLVRYYGNLKRIAVDNAVNLERNDLVVNCYWGGTALGKTRRSWHEARAEGVDVYVKDSSTKWWDSYRGQTCVIIDEFDGKIGITRLLRWFDRYPMFVETKGSSMPLQATKFWITSNIDPNNWFPDASADQLSALRRRMNIVHFLGEWIPPTLPEEVNEFDDLLMSLTSGV